MPPEQEYFYQYNIFQQILQVPMYWQISSRKMKKTIEKSADLRYNIHVLNFGPENGFSGK